MPIQKAVGPPRGGFLRTGRGMAVSLELESKPSRPTSDAEARAPLGKAPAWGVPVRAAPPWAAVPKFKAQGGKVPVWIDTVSAAPACIALAIALCPK